jgi:hypothetical protein
MDQLTTTKNGPLTVFRIPLGHLGLPRRALRKVYEFRREMESETLETFGHVSRVAAKRLHTAACALGEVYMAQIKRGKFERGEIIISAEEERWLSDAIGRNNERCDRALAAMGLNAKPRDEADDPPFETGPPAAPAPMLPQSDPKAAPEEIVRPGVNGAIPQPWPAQGIDPGAQV